MRWVEADLGLAAAAPHGTNDKRGDRREEDLVELWLRVAEDSRSS